MILERIHESGFRVSHFGTLGARNFLNGFPRLFESEFECLDDSGHIAIVLNLRHTFASHFMMKGGNIFDLKSLLGHSDFDMTQIYAHLSPNHLEKAASVVNFGINFGNEKDSGPFLALAE